MTIFTSNKAAKLSKLTGFFAKHSISANMRRAEKELNKCSDRTLEDLGMSRGDIHEKIWGQV
ncbi:MAG: DUF1127 domain-containing protein [OCS116 cluster bacterium]|uniref:YjiS-like domain-containing protein n=1 Tax=OCS116 cluster bacterium TaxID=2030921 RepID=A0A2A4YPI2_9PROT|nr:DUF1127 domain-containing protein [OCS116 cluster bacterium]